MSDPINPERRVYSAFLMAETRFQVHHTGLKSAKETMGAPGAAIIAFQAVCRQNQSPTMKCDFDLLTADNPQWTALFQDAEVRNR